jgi:hypothetical protein
MPMASEAFASAQKETDDDAKRSIARANEILVKRSRQTGYQPKAGAGTAAAGAGAGNKPPAPMPIIEEGDRKAAFAALLADELTTVAPKVRAAKNATNLAAIAEPARALGDLRAIEVAATGAAEQTRQIGADLGERAHQLISDALKQMSNRTEAIWAQASAPNQYAGGYGAPGLHGLTSVESGDLKNIIANSEKVVPVAKDFATVTANAALQGDSAEADKLLARAKEVLSYNYAGVYGLPPASSNLPPGQRNRTNVGIGTGGGYGR